MTCILIMKKSSTCIFWAINFLFKEYLSKLQKLFQKINLLEYFDTGLKLNFSQQNPIWIKKSI